MPFHLHMFNLRDDATTRDIRQLFSGMSIQQDGVTIIGGPNGEAFVTFNSERDLLRAMQMNGEQHLTFKIATDIDKLKGINSMCMSKLQKMKETDSLFLPGTKGNKSHDVHTEKRQQEILSDHGMRRQNCDYPESDMSCNTSIDAKRRRTDVNSPIDIDLRRCGAKEHSESSHRYSRQLTEHHTAPNPGHFPNALPRSTHVFSTKTAITAPTRRFSASTVIPPCHDLEDSLLMNLLPAAGMPRYCIQLTDLPPDVATGMVWSWVGGPTGTTLGVILLKPTNDKPVAFLIYDDELKRDQRLQVSDMAMDKFSAIDTCQFITNFINNWTIWKGKKKLASPIFQTTFSGSNMYVSHRMFYDFAEKFTQVTTTIRPQPPNVFPHLKNTKKTMTNQAFEPHTNVTDEKVTTKPAIKVFLAIYQLKSSTTATEVLSWFSGGMRGFMLCFHDKNGPRDSEAMAFILFESHDECEKAQLIISERGLFCRLFSSASAYRTMSKFGDRCTMTESVFGKERIIGVDEQEQHQFLDAQSHVYQFTLLDSMHMEFLFLKGVSQDASPGMIRCWYPKSLGVVLMQKSLDRTQKTALVAFQSKSHVFHALHIDKQRKLLKRPKNKTPSTFCKGKALALLARIGHVSKITTRVKKPDRKMTIEEAKFLIEKTFVNAGYKESSTRVVKAIPTKAQATREEQASFLHHLKTPDDSIESRTHLYLMVGNVKEWVTACQLHAFYPDALSALIVKFDGNGNDPNDGKAIGCLLLNNVKDLHGARLILGNHIDLWRHTNLPTESTRKYSSKRYESTRYKMSCQSIKKDVLRKLLSRICQKSTILESTPPGKDRILTMEELSVAAVNTPFSLVHEPPCFHYAQLTGIDQYSSAGEMWDWFAGPNSEVKGVVLLVGKTDKKGYIAYLGFSSLESRNRKVEFNPGRDDCWLSIMKTTEQQALDFLAGSHDDYIIMLSTEAGPDRNLDQAEKQLLALHTKMPQQSSYITTRKQMDNETNLEHYEEKLSNKHRSDQSAGENDSLGNELNEKVIISQATVVHADIEAAEKHCSSKPIKESVDDQPAEEQNGVRPADKWSGGQLATKRSELSGNQPSGKLTSDQPSESLGRQPSQELSGCQLSKELSGDQPTEDLDNGQQFEELTGGSPSKELSGGQPTEIVSSSVKKENTGSLMKTKHEFYIRVKTVPTEVTTACQILSLFTADGKPGQCATLVLDSNGVGISAFVLFDQVEDRDFALAQHSFSVKCTSYGRAVRLAEFEPDYDILESTAGGPDRILSMEERDSLEDQFNQ